MGTPPEVRVARVYEPPAEHDGTWARPGSLRRVHRPLPGRTGRPERTAALEQLQELSGQGPLTLLTATRTPEISHAAVLARLLSED